MAALQRVVVMILCMMAAGAGTVRATGLRAYYAFNGDARDLSGNGNDGVIHGGVTTAAGCTGRSNEAFDFNGTDGYVEVPDDSSLEPGELTVCGFVYLRSLVDPRGADHVVRKRYLTNDDSYLLTIRTDDARVEFGLNIGSGNPEDGRVASGQALAFDRWYYLAGTYDGQHLRLYVNGQFENESAYSTPIQYDSGVLELTSASYEWGRDEFIDGRMDEIRIYGRALSGPEIEQLAQCPPGELVAYYPFNCTAEDASGHDLDGQVHGGVTCTEDCANVSGQAFDFNGIDGYVEVQSDPLLEPAGLTLAGYVFLRSLDDPRSADHMIRKRYLTNDDSYLLTIRTTDARAEFSINRGSGNPADGIVASDTELELNRWHHVAATYDGTRLRVFVDGWLRGELPYSTPIAYDGGVLELTSASYVGGRDEYIDGKMDEIRIYDYALDQNGIQDLLDCVPPVPVRETSWGQIKSMFH